MPHTKPSIFFRWTTCNRSLTERWTTLMFKTKPPSVERIYYRFYAVQYQFQSHSQRRDHSMIFFRMKNIANNNAMEKVAHPSDSSWSCCYQIILSGFALQIASSAEEGFSSQETRRRCLLFLLLLIRINETLCRKIENCTLYDRNFEQ